MKRVYLSRKNKKIFGMCGGIGETYDIDPTMVRLMAIFLCITTGIVPLLLTYLAAWIIVPEKYNYVKAVRFQGFVTTDAKDDSKFNILICDEKFVAIKTFQFQASDITDKPGFSGWIILEIQPTKVPKDFAIGIASDQIINIGTDSKSSGKSFFAPSGGKVRSVTYGGDWLIRAIVE